jgi:trehalose 6-phosphate synthase
MARAARSILVLVLVVGLLTAGAAVLIRAQTRSWFESDVNLRARLAVNGARMELLDSWRTNPTQLAMVLGELARGEEILGACACTGSGESLARTGEYPPEMPCSEVLAYIQADGPDERFGHWSRVQPLPGGEVHFAALPLGDGSEEGSEEGFVVLAHDYSFVAIRETRALFFLLAVFVLLSLGGGYLTIRASRRSWRTWSEELRGFLQGDGPPKAFKPILSDVRELVDRLMDQEGRAWTPKRLKETLRHQLEGETVVVLANREPYVHQRKPNGEIETMHPASGLVTALEPIMRACSGTWIAHGAGSADRDTSDRNGRLRVPPGEGSYTLRRIWLTTEEERGYYYGFANEGLWPLCHIAHTRPLFRSEDWEYYRSVNKKFALTVREEVDSDDPIVLVQDYHFAVAPAFIRKKLPKATIISFWHIPWPNAELFGICPFRD